MKIQFIDEYDATWPVVKMDDVPRINDVVDLPDQNKKIVGYLVKTVVWAPFDQSVTIRYQNFASMIKDNPCVIVLNQ